MRNSDTAGTYVSADGEFTRDTNYITTRTTSDPLVRPFAEGAPQEMSQMSYGVPALSDSFFV